MGNEICSNRNGENKKGEKHRGECDDEWLTAIGEESSHFGCPPFILRIFSAAIQP
jgi:hypothetical protein